MRPTQKRKTAHQIKLTIKGEEKSVEYYSDESSALDAIGAERMIVNIAHLMQLALKKRMISAFNEVGTENGQKSAFNWR